MAPQDIALLDTRFHPHEPASDAGREIESALLDLPAHTRETVHERLSAIVANYSENRQVDPVLHFIESLTMTARLHRNPAYCDALAIADASRLQSPPEDSGDVADFMKALRERQAR